MREFTQQLLLRNIQKADTLCEQCFKVEEMLCNGQRPYLTDGRVQQGFCRKFYANAKAQAQERRLDATGLPKAALTKQYDFDPAAYPESHVFAVHDERTRCLLWEYGVWQTLETDKRFRYIHQALFVRKFTDWAGLLSKFSETDTLMVDRYDSGGMPDYVVDSMAELMLYRIANEKQTILTLSSLMPNARTKSEEELYDVMEGYRWKSN
jgi:hypothetical protein